MFVPRGLRETICLSNLSAQLYWHHNTTPGSLYNNSNKYDLSNVDSLP